MLPIFINYTSTLKIVAPDLRLWHELIKSVSFSLRMACGKASRSSRASTYSSNSGYRWTRIQSGKTAKKERRGILRKFHFWGLRHFYGARSEAVRRLSHDVRSEISRVFTPESKEFCKPVYSAACSQFQVYPLQRLETASRSKAVSWSTHGWPGGISREIVRPFERRCKGTLMKRGFANLFAKKCKKSAFFDDFGWKIVIYWNE